jgi:CubicO group peptidase (beta-lactamase class C family)
MTELINGSPADAGMRPERLDLLRRRAAQWVDDGETPTLVILAARRGVVCLHESWGQHRPGGPPVDKDAVFPMSSITKPITAALAMMLAEDGELGLNRPIGHYLPEIDVQGAEHLQVNHLLTHTSGYNADDVDAYRRAALSAGVDPPPPEQTQNPLTAMLLASAWGAPLRTPPATEMSYCDQNYLLAGEIVRRVSGRTLEAFARERLFDPLGLSSTWYEVPDSARERVIERPTEAPQPVPHNPFFEGLDSVQMQKTPYGNAGVFSNALDIAVLIEMFRNGGEYGGVRVLSPATAAEMTRNQIPGIGAEFLGRRYREGSWGYGWQIQGSEKWKYWAGELLAPGSFMHGGFGGAFAWCDPHNEIVGVMLMAVMKITEDWEHICNLDLIQNQVQAAVAD